MDNQTVIALTVDNLYIGLNLRISFRFYRKSVQFVCRLFAGVQPRGQQAVDAINSYLSLVNMLNTSMYMALAASRTIHETMAFLSSVDDLDAAVNESVAASTALQQAADRLNSRLAASG